MRILNFLILIFTTILTVFFLFLVSLWWYIDHEEMPSFVKTPKTEYDFIIVGSGTAGSVLAHELAKYSNYKILLIEAGERFGVLSKIPLLSTTLQGTYVDWSFKTVPQEYSSKGLHNQQQKYPRGKGLGGSSQINYMLHYGGIKNDFNRWSALGLKNWTFDHIKPFLTSPTEDEDDESFCSLTESNECSNSNQTPNPVLMKIDRLQGQKMAPGSKIDESQSSLCKAFLNAQKHISTPAYFKLSEYNTVNGNRHSTYHTYLRQAFKFKNLSIMTKTIVLKILFENKTAVGVQVSRQFEKTITIRAKKEIIIAAGAIQSPQLLKISGVGPREELENLKIPVIHDNKFVGENLHDHLNHPIYSSITEPASVNLMKIINIQEIKNYLTKGTGVYSNMAIYGQGRELNGEFGVILFGIGSVDENALREIANYKTEVFRAFFPLYKNIYQEGFTMLSTCLQPKSRGNIMLNSTNMREAPLINPKFLKNPEDIKCMIKAVKLSVSIIQSPPFQRLGTKIHWPKLKECETNTNYPSDEYLECIIRNGALTANHPGGTCSMGPEGVGVVDEEFRVRGISNLRVVDASVLPTPVSGTPNYLITVIASRAAHFILSSVKPETSNSQ